MRELQTEQSNAHIEEHNEREDENTDGANIARATRLGTSRANMHTG